MGDGGVGVVVSLELLLAWWLSGSRRTTVSFRNAENIHTDALRTTATAKNFKAIRMKKVYMQKTDVARFPVWYHRCI